MKEVESAVFCTEKAVFKNFFVVVLGLCCVLVSFLVNALTF